MVSLRRKVLKKVGWAVGGMAFILLITGSALIFAHAHRLESEMATQNALRVARALDREAEQLDLLVRDWAFWDDLYEFVINTNETFIGANLPVETFRSARLSFIVIANRNGEYVYAQAFNKMENVCAPISPEFEKFLEKQGLLNGFESIDDIRRGLLRVNNELFIVAMRAILTSAEEGPSRGTFMMGRRVDDEVVRELADIARVNLGISLLDETPACRRQMEKLQSARHAVPVGVCRPRLTTISGCLLLKDLLNEPVAILEAKMPRIGFFATLRHLGLFWGMVVAVCGAALIGTWGALNRLVLGRMAYLHNFVSELSKKDTLSARLPISGEDELGVLAESFNLLLDKLQSTMGDLQQAEKNLLEQGAFLRSVLDAHPGYVWVKDARHRFLLVNRGLADFCQSTPEDMIGREDAEFNPQPDEVARYHREDDEVLRTGRPMVIPEEHITAPNGAEIWISTYKIPLKNASGKCDRVLSVAVDITEQKRNRDALQQSEERYRRLYENAPVAIILWDSRQRVIGWNPWAQTIFGWTSHEVLWREWISRLIPPADQSAMAGICAAIIAEGSTQMHECAAVNKAGGLLRCEWYHAAIRDAQGQFVAGISFVVDVTEKRRVEEERRQLESQMLQSQKLESIGVLASGIAHDFNNILMAILGNADLALTELPADSSVRTTMEEIILGARRAADLCRQLLAYSGHGRFVIEPVDLNQIVREMVNMLEVAVSKRVILRFEYADSLPAIEADSTQLRQVLMNLVINASEAIGTKDGLVHVRTGVKECSREFLNSTLLGNKLSPGLYVYLEVSDTGCGMTREMISRIFEPFFTTKFTGRGLGLAAVLGIVRSHDGTIEVQSAPEKGTTFRTYFPVSPKAAVQKPEEMVAAQWRGTGTILVVDDEDTVRTLAARMLERCGFKVLLAGDGSSAIHLLSAHSNEITAVLLDLTMPHMDGHEAITEIRKLAPRIPVVLTSGYSEQELSLRFREFTNIAFLEKPYTRAALITTFRKLLHT